MYYNKFQGLIEYLYMNLIPRDLILHIVGIGGIGMSAIARILYDHGYRVQGSDLSGKSLDFTIKIFKGHAPENVADADVVIRSSAVKDDNVEIIAARTQNKPVISRAQILAELMRCTKSVAISGTHGKTTTTAMIASIFEAANLDSSVICGGIMNNYKSNARSGKGDWMVVEADESDQTFIKIPYTIAVILNIEPEHLENYEGEFFNLYNAFKLFAQGVPFYGFVVLCIDDPYAFKLSQELDSVITYSAKNPDADLLAKNISNDGKFCLILSEKLQQLGHVSYKMIHQLSVPIIGMYNVYNSMAAAAVAIGLGLSIKTIRDGLANFSGVMRRFTHVGTANGIKVIDDYAHHPTEIAATMAAANSVSKRVIAIIQPHRFSRMRDCFDDFATVLSQIDHLILLDVFPAGEKMIEGFCSANLHDRIKRDGVIYLQNLDELNSTILQIAKPDDLVVFMGAGNITVLAYNFYHSLSE